MGHVGRIVAEVFRVEDDVPTVHAVTAAVSHDVSRLKRVVVRAEGNPVTFAEAIHATDLVGYLNS